MTIVHQPSRHKKASVLKETKSTKAQKDTEIECEPYFTDLRSMPASQLDDLRRIGLLSQENAQDYQVKLLREKHIQYLEQVWKDGESLKASFVSLDASRTWMCYWTLHACDLMGHGPMLKERHNILETIKSCWSQDVTQGAGFGGGPGQLPHAATTYAAVMTLCILATDDPVDDVSKLALQTLRASKESLSTWIHSLIQEDGSVRMHDNGELDVRASYCIMAVARLLNLKIAEAATSKMVEHLLRCQTFEGGFGGEPYTEAHGGYTFCAVAALQLLGSLERANLHSLTSWLANMQCGYEGGFCGRTNKLVDGCYSFWQGGAMTIVSQALGARTTNDRVLDPWLVEDSVRNELLFDQGMLQRYILLCAQNVTGGLRDKPSARRDFYHSCYNLSGLSVSQEMAAKQEFGHDQSMVLPTHPCFNLRVDRVRKIVESFK